MELQALDEEKIVAAVIADLETQLASVDHTQIETTVRRTVRAWWQGARVKAFVGIIAARHARDELRQVATQETNVQP